MESNTNNSNYGHHVSEANDALDTEDGVDNAVPVKDEDTRFWPDKRILVEQLTVQVFGKQVHMDTISTMQWSEHFAETLYPYHQYRLSSMYHIPIYLSTLNTLVDAKMYGT